MPYDTLTQSNQSVTTQTNESSKQEVPRKRTQSGCSTSNLVQSAYMANNGDVFPEILKLYAEPGAAIADITYGNGVFWRNVDTSQYNVQYSDVKTGTDFTNLPHGNASLDMLVFDPPYMEGFYRKSASQWAGSGTYSAFRSYYSNGKEHSEGPKYHDAVLSVYCAAAIEAKRILRDHKYFVVKCQDEVSANRQKLTHVELIYAFEEQGFYCKDLFVVVRKNPASASRVVKQQHSRKRHSYFLIFQKAPRNLPYSNFRDTILRPVAEDEVAEDEQ